MVNVTIGINEANVTLTERSELSSPFYLLKLTYTNNTDNVKIGNVLDLTPGARVNQMQIELVTESSLEDLANGKFFLTGGDYIYEFYESEVQTLEITGLTKLEEGLLRYDTQLDSEEYTGDTSTDFVYQG